MSPQDIPADQQQAPIDGTDEARARAAAAREAANVAKRKVEEVVRDPPSGLSKKARKATPRTKTSTHTVAVPEGFQPDAQQRDPAVYGGWSPHTR